MKISLNTFPVSSKTAITLFLILLWYGYLLAALNTRLSVGLTAESIADHYSDHSLTKSETQDIEQKGFSEEEVVIEDEEEGDNNEQKQEVRSKKQDERNTIEIPSPQIGKTGGGVKLPSPLTGEGQSLPPKYLSGGGGEQWPSSAEDIHHADHEPDHAKEGSKDNTGTITPQEIIQLGHIHILGFSLLFISLGIILSLTGIRELFKVVILLILFLSFALDIGGLLLVRFVSPTLAILTVISGIGTGICMAVISLVAMYDMWIRKSTVMESC